MLRAKPHEWIGRAAALCALTFVLGVPAAARADTLHCGDTVTHNISLANDLTNCPQIGDGIDIGADGLTIRLNGHTISAAPVCQKLCSDILAAPNNGESVGINFQGHSHITLIGGPGNSVRGFEFGAVVSGDHNVIEQLTTSQSAVFDYPDFFDGVGVRIDGNYDRVNDSSQLDNTTLGLQMNGTGDTVSHDLTSGNGGGQNPTAAVALFGSDDSLSYSRILKNPVMGDGVADFGNNDTVSHDTIDSGRYGVDVEGGSAIITANTITKSGDQYYGAGVLVTGLNTMVVGNQQLWGTIAGYVDQGTGTTFVGNRAQATPLGFWLFGSTGATLKNNVAGSIGTTSGGGGGNGIGILVSDSASGSVLTKNNASNNLGEKIGTCSASSVQWQFPCGADGIRIEGSSNTTVSNNTTNFNVGDGVNANSNGGVLTANVADYNKRYGIENLGSMADGGHNNATGNHLGQCVNLAC